jgi:AraC family transcriptional regulator
MLLRSFPHLGTASGEFRQWFHSKWGRENCIVLGRSRRSDFGPCMHTLSIRAAWGGTEYCHVGGRTVGVDDDSFLILNHGRVYSTAIRAPWPVQSLSICFRPGLVEETQAAMARSLEQVLDGEVALEAASPEFMENLRPHDKLVSPVLRFIKVHLLQGVDDEAWYEEQMLFLLERMHAHRERTLALADELRLIDRARRRELFRRIGVATDFLHTSYVRQLDLDEVARVACLSKYHFLRLFTRIHGITPVAYLQRKRAAVAVRLLQTTRLSVNEVAASVGFPERTTLLRQIRRWAGLSPRQIRQERIPRRLPRLVATVG